MTGKVKVTVSSDEKQVNPANIHYDGKWEDSSLHFRDHNGHTLILNDKNIYYIIITNTTVEGESLLFEADAWKIKKGEQVDTKGNSIELEFRFTPYWWIDPAQNEKIPSV